MLFMVISTPRPERPSERAADRTRYWPWLAAHERAGRCKGAWAKVGRGAVVLLDVATHDELHAILNEWADIIPATFEVLPLIDTSAAKGFLAGKAGSSPS
ncbi:MAG TPA: hypothetical protein PK264_16975 [Hyphomicrobiaceae bacterium]|nr:hypothetical protein [Hyphomicrobiaceae bacterium]